jgi:hypothetical protein
MKTGDSALRAHTPVAERQRTRDRDWRPVLTREERYELIRAADIRAQARIADGDYGEGLPWTR